MTQELSIRAFFDQATNTVTYLVWTAKTRIAALIESVLDYDPGGGKVSASGVDKVLAAAAGEKLQIQCPRSRRAWPCSISSRAGTIPHRRHSALDYLSPNSYQRNHSAQADFRSPAPSTETR